MQKTTQNRKKALSLRAAGALVGLSCLALVLLATPLVKADYYDDQINALNAQNNSNYQALTVLGAQAASYQDAIAKLQGQINALQAQITDNENKQASLQQQIVEKQAEIDHEREVLAADVKAMYVDDQMTTIEMLATSKNLSDYVDKEEYRTAIQKKLQDTLAQITKLQQELQAQKVEVDKLLADQKNQQTALNAVQAQQNQMLAYTQSQQAAYNQQISANSSKIASLRQQQIAANSRFIGAAGSGPTCGGGYPAQWCEIPQDSVVDSWGMYNRECVSYTAFRVAASGRHMPYWGGVGNANQWDDNARAAGIPVDGNPRAGDVAISNSGYYGHAMYVESVNGNGTINISQYNAALNGRFSTNTISVGSLVFIHFP